MKKEYHISAFALFVRFSDGWKPLKWFLSFYFGFGKVVKETTQRKQKKFSMESERERERKQRSRKMKEEENEANGMFRAHILLDWLEKNSSS